VIVIPAKAGVQGCHTDVGAFLACDAALPLDSRLRGNDADVTGLRRTAADPGRLAPRRRAAGCHALDLAPMPARPLVVASLLLAGCACLAPGYSDVALEGLFNAERDFARDASLIGARPAFLKHFDDDAITFLPGPVRFVDHARAHPVADPMATLLEWGPQSGAVSRAGDLGFTTGPTRWSKRGEPRGEVGHGYYFSVWSRASGTWKVVLDAGVPQPAPAGADDLPNMRTPIDFSRATVTLDPAARVAARDALFAMERAPRSLGVAMPGAPAPWRDLLGPSPVLVQAGITPLRGRDVAGFADAAPPTRVEWMPSGGAVASSGDLAYTYGASRTVVGTAAPVEGYYVHVWQREATGDWKLKAEADLPG
jgi:ketosteroid isomerase-like protein